MTHVHASITTSVDGYIAGPDDGPGCGGLGVGGERLHYWVFGGPWTYDTEPRGEATGEDKAWLDEAMEPPTARWSPAGEPTKRPATGVTPTRGAFPFFIVTHRPEEQPAGEPVHLRGAASADAIERRAKRRCRRQARRT